MIKPHKDSKMAKWTKESGSTIYSNNSWEVDPDNEKDLIKPHSNSKIKADKSKSNPNLMNVLWSLVFLKSYTTFKWFFMVLSIEI